MKMSSLAYLTRPDTLRLHLGEMSAQKLRTAQAAIRLALSSHAQEIIEREHIKELKRLCAQAYQIVGALASECDRFEDEAVQKHWITSANFESSMTMYFPLFREPWLALRHLLLSRLYIRLNGLNNLTRIC